MRPSISAVYVIHNDLAFFRHTAFYEMAWADQLCVLDLGSTDGLGDWCRTFLRPQDKYERRPTNTCPTLGFSEAKNAACALATCDWLYYSAADQVLMPSDRSRIHQVIAAASAVVLSMGCYNVLAKEDDRPHNMDAGILRAAESGASRLEHHRRLARRDAGIISKGYIHEEPYYPTGENCYRTAGKTDLAICHFADWDHAELRRQRYAWMFQRAMENPDLQQFTNRWWFDTYYPQNSERIKMDAKLYEQYVASTGLA